MLKYHNLFKLIATSICCLFISACGPMYSTRYVMTPPKSEGGYHCISQCEALKGECHQAEELKEQNCQLQSEIDEADCESYIWSTKGREPKWYECGWSSCSADHDRCDADYRTCYQSCGGRVEAITECVANCDKIPKDQAKR